MPLCLYGNPSCGGGGDKNTLDLVPLNADLDFKDLKKMKDNLISVKLECCSRTSELLLVMKDFDAISGE